MNVLVLKTNIDNEQMLNIVHDIFNNIDQVRQWSVDQDDIDKVLRIEVSEKITESDVIHLLSQQRILCEELAS